MKRLRRTKKRILDTPSTGPTEKLEVQSLAKHFPALEHEKLERLAGEMSLMRFKRGDRILVDPQSPTDIFLVLKGAIAVTWQHDGRHQVLVTLLSPGEIFCVTSLLPEMAQGLKGYAFTNSLVGSINSKRLLDIVLGVPLAAFKSAMEMTVGWSAETLMRYVRMFHVSPRDRLVIALIEMGAKFGVRDSRGLILNLPMTQKDLANLPKGPGQPARRVAAKSQRVSRPVGPPGRSDQSETSDRSRPRQTLRPDWRSRTPLPQRSRKASWIETAS